MPLKPVCSILVITPNITNTHLDCEYCTAVCLLSGHCHSNRIFFGAYVGTPMQHNLQLGGCELYLKDLLFYLIWFVVMCVCVHETESISLLP